MNMSECEHWLQAHRSEHLQQLQDFLRIPSISALSAHKADVQRCAEFLAEQARWAGLEHVELLPTAGNPVVYADWLHAPEAPTVVVYGHYDVQPVDPLDLWQTPPFEPDVRDDRIYARGASDDKGPTLMHLIALRAILQTRGQLPVNIKLCLEGEEEVGSRNLPAFLEQNASRYDGSDLLLISDTTMLGPDQPSVCYGLRGLAPLQIDLRTARQDLHSGLYGGPTPNAASALAELLASFHDADGRVQVEGFYDHVVTANTGGAAGVPRSRARRARICSRHRRASTAGRAGVQRAGTLVGAPDLGDQRHVERLSGGRHEDRHSLRSAREDHLPAGSRSRSGRNPGAAHPSYRAPHPSRVDGRGHCSRNLGHQLTSRPSIIQPFNSLPVRTRTRTESRRYSPAWAARFRLSRPSTVCSASRPS